MKNEVDSSEVGKEQWKTLEITTTKEDLQKEVAKFLMLADACSDALFGGERGWERLEFEEFVKMCRKAIAKGMREG